MILEEREKHFVRGLLSKTNQAQQQGNSEVVNMLEKYSGQLDISDLFLHSNELLLELNPMSLIKAAS